MPLLNFDFLCFFQKVWSWCNENWRWNASNTLPWKKKRQWGHDCLSTKNWKAPQVYKHKNLDAMWGPVDIIQRPTNIAITLQYEFYHVKVVCRPQLWVNSRTLRSNLYVVTQTDMNANYFLLLELEEAIMVKILIKMLIVSMYIPMDLQEKGWIPLRQETALFCFFLYGRFAPRNSQFVPQKQQFHSLKFKALL